MWHYAFWQLLGVSRKPYDVNKPRVRGPPLGLRVSGARVKNEFMAKSFFAKITPTTMGGGNGQNCENVICN